MITAPALRRLSTTGLLTVAITSFCNVTPLVVAKPARVHIDLDRHRHARERAGVFAARQSLVHLGRLRQRILGPVIDHGVDQGIHRLQAIQRALRGLDCGNIAPADTGGKLNCGQTPKIGHAALLCLVNGNRRPGAAGRSTLAPLARVH